MRAGSRARTRLGVPLRILVVAALVAGAGPCGGCGGRGGAGGGGGAADPAGAPVPAPTASEAQPAREGIRIQLVHDRTTGVTTFQVGESPAGDAAALEPALTAAEQEWTRTRRTRPTVIITAAESVPWKDVVTAVNACKAAGLSKVEFDHEGRPR